ncbi:MAG: hypothetical protein IIZ39_07855, partial [Blautia sp.]|nr:hypothetical protein [Blautia sp.]
LCTPCWTITWSAFVVSLTIICILFFPVKNWTFSRYKIGHFLPREARTPEEKRRKPLFPGLSGVFSFLLMWTQKRKMACEIPILARIPAGTEK